MKGIILVCGFLGLLGLNRAQIAQLGQCDENIQLENDFDVDAFMGTWYEIARIPSPTLTADCSTIELASDNTSISIYNSAVNRNFFEENTGVVSQSTDARFTVQFEGSNTTRDFWILGTNYTTYALAYTCENLSPTQRNVYIWHLGRTSDPPTEPVQTLISTTLLNTLNLNANVLRAVQHTEDACTRLPVIGQNEPVLLAGQCDPNIPVVQNFTVSRFLGEWHEIASYYSDNALGSCSRAQYRAVGDGVEVLNSQVINQALFTIYGTASVASSDESGILNVELNVLPNGTAQQTLYIIATDYENYAISYSCDNVSNDTKRVFSWILGRSPTLPAQSELAVEHVIDSIVDLNRAYYQDTRRSDDDCFFFPEVETSQSVIFRGQCNESIPAVANFDPVRYEGLWHDIESYPSQFQIDGSCNNAIYTLRNDVVDVYNTQVINQSLSTINGEAIIDPEANGSGKLIVSFPIAGTNSTSSTTYWILATDYETYSLVYSCSNYNEDSRVVFSWKLGRSKLLPAAASTAINNVIADIPVLDQRYFVAKNQTEEGCFYYPEPQESVPVVFPGQCDENIDVINNFNMEQFAGSWREIEAYPEGVGYRQCVSHVYSTGNTNNTLNMQSTYVVNQFLDTSESNVTFQTTENNGRLLITNTVNGITTPTPFWVLATDYTNYALAYSCVNMNSDFREVRSWKLSRTESLTNASITAIDEAISNIQVLDNMFYESIEHTDDACFYLPELEAGEPVVLEGQCDLNITVVENFNAARYMGLWHLIESYPSEFQNGNCNDATYTTIENGTVVVFNTQVINETLDTITGSAVADADGNGKLTVTFPNASPTDYWILDTDYSSYSLVYSCANINAEQRQVWSWKLSRTKSLTEAASNAINQVINSVNVLNNRFYEMIDNSDNACFYYPEVTGNPVVFRGQCDDSISVVTNFNATEYLGVWYDIQSYPQQFQGGSCPTATYSLGSAGVDVYNTQVLNQTLDTINGVATLANDTEAKLEVVFPILGNFTVTSPYWVLATDYSNYALVYACTNLPGDLRSVSSWKLSRQKTLSAASQTAINNIVNNIPVLRQDYYQIQDQTEQGCFYYPESVAGEAVIFPGQCDATIQAVPNFDLSRFSGMWNEIEAYPTEQQQGQCINHQLNQTSANTSSLLNNRVVDQLLQTNEGSVVSTDGSGQLELTIFVNNQTLVIPFWVLSTDYDNYALIYSCMNINDNFRGVMSWKLSRTKTLSAAANTAINNAISSIEVLDNRYYEIVPQTDSACFYYPELSLEEPVIFVGQCNESIPAMSNFSPARYAGRWNDIESYHDDDYFGTCGDTTFTQLGNNFEITFTQVLDQQLYSQQRTASIAADGSARFTITENNETVTYNILATDYSTYSLVYSCTNRDSSTRRVRAWKLSRERELTWWEQSQINNVMSSIDVLDDRYFNARNQSASGCFYYPDHVPGQVVTFRGQCNSNVQVVQNFSVENYAGLWYDIEHYPQNFQRGTCATAQYSVDENGVNVLNSEVVNQQLSTINGVAVLATDDGSAKLTVSFPVDGVPGLTTSSPYWVLATDYNSYALVYSCTNLDEEHNRVTVWKLSRTQNLTANANTVINNVMNEVPVIRQQYFSETGQSEEDCFAYPDNFGGPVYLDGQCSDANEVDVLNSFNSTLFAGTWHEVARFPSEMQTGECGSATLINSTPNSFNIAQFVVLNERLSQANGTGSVSGDGRGIISAVLSNPSTGDSTTLDLYVLDTNYGDYALVYSCRNVNVTSKQIYSWKLSRSRAGLSQADNEAISAQVSNNIDLFEGYYEEVDQSNDACFYYPEFDPLPEAINLPGPCNDTIRGIANFSAADYLGRWFEIASYPQLFQNGNCSRAEYSAGTDEVIIINTQVVNQTLDTMTGSAVVSSDDGTGLLSVTFDVNGVTNVANYYILATDYTDYALVYSCRNLDNGDSQVTSWKLSRTRTLSAQANTVMDNIIQSTRGLLEDYYTPTSQSDADCLYIPELNPNEAPVFRGQCDQNIVGVQNFNVQSYLGWWHEVERYPSNNSAPCTSSQLQAVGTGYQVVDISVSGGVGSYDSVTVVATNDGRLRRTYSDGRIVDTWVLATDYETYSLLYSCENINDEYRRVWSAKHSKARSLTDAAQNAMAPIIATNPVLVSNFYQSVDQSDQACFHYPAQTGQQIILPGQCDLNIPVVMNFDVFSYSGTWYQIERYPQIHESGECTGARYTLEESTGVVKVLNWEVVNGTLETIEGTAVVTYNDTSARLTVTLPIVGTNVTVTTWLYVLSTDYISYTLAYSCVNVNQFQRAVGAWKLSRDRTMPANGVTAINSYMVTRQELHQPYFIQVAHNEDCEEPSGSFVVKSSIIVILVCGLLQLLF